MPSRPKVLDLAKMSLYAYENQAINGAIPGWNWSGSYGTNNHNAIGFFAKGYTGAIGGRLTAVFAIRGTDDFRDAIISDAQMAIGVSPEQFEVALEYFQEFYDDNPDAQQYYLTGHSLGGGLASILSAYHNKPVATFNAPGVVRSFVSLKTSGICSGFMRHYPPLQSVCQSSRDLIRSNVNEEQMLNIRAKYDAVSIGTGDVFGKTIEIPVPTHFDFEKSDMLVPLKGIGAALGQGAAMLMTQHSMAQVVYAVQSASNALFSRYGWG